MTNTFQNSMYTLEIARTDVPGVPPAFPASGSLYGSSSTPAALTLKSIPPCSYLP